jgi:hypothetical protein
MVIDNFRVGSAFDGRCGALRWKIIFVGIWAKISHFRIGLNVRTQLRVIVPRVRMLGFVVKCCVAVNFLVIVRLLTISPYRYKGVSAIL